MATRTIATTASVSPLVAITPQTWQVLLIQRHKRYPASLRDSLASALVVRHTADYGHAGVSQRIAQRMGRRAAQFGQAVEEAVQR